MPAEKIPLEEIDSSNLNAIGYNRAKQILAVQFRNGLIMHYAGFPLEKLQEFYAAESRGSYYAKNIRGRYQAERMTGRCPKCAAEGWIGDRCDDCGTAAFEAVPLKEK